MLGYTQDPLRLSASAAPPFANAVRAAWSGARRWLARTWMMKALRAVVAERRARTAIHELRSWDDHMLRDVGLERMDIEAVIRGVRPPFRWEPDCDPAARHRLENFH